MRPVELWDLAQPTAAGRRVILVDGGSGAGKTTFAHALAQAGPVGAQVVSLDSFYPGWDGLVEASRAVVDDLLGAECPGYWGWDWERDERTSWCDVDLSRPTVIEGCGALTPASRALASCAVWLEADADERKRRALERDGDAFAPHWAHWAAQEAAHWRRDRPWELADVVVEGARWTLACRA